MSNIFITETITFCDVCEAKQDGNIEGWLWWNSKDICPACCTKILNLAITSKYLVGENLEEMIDDIKCQLE